MNRRTFAALCTLPVWGAIRPVSFSGAGRAPAIRPPSEAFQEQIPRLMEIAGVPGIALCIVQDSRIVWQHAYGIADRRTGAAVDRDTLWVAASLGKPVFAFAALRLADEGKLDLDQPLKTYVPDHLPDDEQANRITARQVLSHTTGLPNWRRDAGAPLKLAFDPGTQFQYSGEGYFYLQRAVEQITGQGLDRFMLDRLFTPLGMASSVYGWRPDLADRVVAGHNGRSTNDVFWKDLALNLQRDADDRRRALVDYTGDEMRSAMARVAPNRSTLPQSLIPNAAYSLVTTPADYAAYLIALLGGQPTDIDLKPETRRLVVTPTVRINSALGWGLGLGIETSEAGGAEPEDVYLWQWGDNDSWKNFVLAHPESRSAMVIFTNGSTGHNLCQRIVRAATGIEHPAFLWI